ncbi:M12 family metallopeptidase [Pseudobdellovibrio sp. HCB154]|uniref:M12 family metallopeptidase n=1 Tax=Pseudobdellovibrio sp. HCB154 TaxID=3386277 RepID=UPI003916E096
MVKIVLILFFSQMVYSQELFHYFEDYRLKQSQITTEMASGFYAYESQPWQNGIVPVEFDRSISKDYRNRFMAACKVWSDVANVRCRLRKSTDIKYLFVTDKNNRCWTDVGSGSGRQEFNFSFDWCWEKTKLIHELGHVFGFMHEHQRPDRDKYLKVNLANAGEYAFAYEKLSFGSLDKSTPYDFMSIMHYWNAAYSVNGRPIMVPRPGYEKYTNTMGTSKSLTKGDRDLVRRVYGLKPSE